jgi:hypothetical protein
MLFTTPSYNWAHAFRNGDMSTSLMGAEFELADGRKVTVPSFILPEEEQLSLINRSGLLSNGIAYTVISDLKTEHLSPKLFLQRGPDAHVVAGYFVSKASSRCSTARP